jgi:hypothetical protein
MIRKNRASARRLVSLGAFSAGLSLLALAGCHAGAPHGPPVLLKVYWQVKGQQIAVWTPDGTGVTSPVSPAPTQFNLIYDRVMDGSRIEDTINLPAGGTTQRPKVSPSIDGGAVQPDPPVIVSWPGMDTAVSVPPFSISVWYNSLHLTIPDSTASEMLAAANTSYIYGREVPSYPSNTPVSLTLLRDHITSEYGEPTLGPDQPIVIQTAPFTLALQSPASPVLTNYWLPLPFSNRPVDPGSQLSAYVHVTAAGNPLPFILVPDPDDPTLVNLQPGSGSPNQPDSTWPVGTPIDVTVDATLPDIFGAPLGTAAAAVFTACAAIATDGAAGCGPVGAADAGAADAGAADAGAADAGAD